MRTIIAWTSQKKSTLIKIHSTFTLMYIQPSHGCDHTQHNTHNMLHYNAYIPVHHLRPSRDQQDRQDLCNPIDTNQHSIVHDVSIGAQSYVLFVVRTVLANMARKVYINISFLYQLSADFSYQTFIYFIYVCLNYVCTNLMRKFKSH